MSDLEYAQEMLALAQGDLKALAEMQDEDRFENRIFGFHAQQVVEKGLKAWIAFLGEEFPATHDIRLLLAVLRNRGCDVDRFKGVDKYNPFAVRLRYRRPVSPPKPLDRPSTLAEARELVEHIEKLIKNSEDTD